MVYIVKVTALLLVVVAVCAGSECNDQECGEYAPRPKAPQQTIKISQPARASVPINIETEDYCGPYDPFDPKGVFAAHRREMKMKGKDFMEELKSYYPKGLAKFLKREAIKLAIGEGKRFAVCHPKETAMLVDLFVKVKRLFSTLMDKVDKECGCKKGDKPAGLEIKPLC